MSSNISLTTEEKIEFYEAIGYKDHSNSQELIYPNEVQLIFVFFHLHLKYFL